MRGVERTRIALSLAVAVAGAVALPVLLDGCRPSAPARAGRDGEGDGERPAGATLTSSTSVRAVMRDHDVHGAAMRDAVVRGDLDGARREAAILAELRAGDSADPAWRARLDAMSAAAGRVAHAKDLPDASASVADVARTCGDCHLLGGPPPSVLEKPETEPGITAGMKRHRWATARLWDGLVVPSDRAWRAGAHVLRDAPLEPEPAQAGASPLPALEQLAIATLATSVHELGERASVANASVDRGAVYGQLMTTCAACHSRVAQGLR